jgi:hypothetical protein
MEENKPKNTKMIAIIAAIAVAVVALVVVLIVVLGGKKAAVGIVGKWAYAEGPNYIYNFREGGTGSYGYCSDDYSAQECEDYASNFTYKLVENEGKKQIEFLYEGNTSPMTLDYKLEGDKLIITDSFGEEVPYNRSK